MESHIEQSKKEVYYAQYTMPAFIAGPIDKYVEREGCFEDEIDQMMRKIHDILIDNGSLISQGINPHPFLTSGILGGSHLNKAYRMLNCIVEQDIRTGSFHINNVRYNLVYTVSIMGRKNPVENAIEVLSGKLFRDMFEGRLVKPVIRMYENPYDCNSSDFHSISSMEEKLHLVATMENKKWKRVEDEKTSANNKPKQITTS